MRRRADSIRAPFRSGGPRSSLSRAATSATPPVVRMTPRCKRALFAMASMLVLSTARAQENAAGPAAGDEAAQLARARDHVKRVAAQLQARDDRGAAATAREGIEQLDAVPTFTNELAAEIVFFDLGRVAFDQRELAAAKRAFTRAVTLLEHLNLPHDGELQSARCNLGAVYMELGDVAEGRRLLEIALAGLEPRMPKDDPILLTTRINLAVARKRSGDLAGARVLEEQALTTVEATLPKNHPTRIALRINLGDSAMELGDQVRARRLYERALADLDESQAAPDDESRIAAMQGLASSMVELGDCAGGRLQYERLLALEESRLAPDDPQLAGLRHNLADAMRRMGDAKGALPLLEATEAAFARTLPPGSRDLVVARLNLGQALAETGQTARARELVETTLTSARTALSEENVLVQQARQQCALLLRECGDLAGARRLLEEALAHLKSARSWDEGSLDAMRTPLILTLAELGERQALRPLLSEYVAGNRRLALAASVLPPIARQAALSRCVDAVATLLSFVGDGDDRKTLERQGFELSETIRGIANGLGPGDVGGGDDLHELRERIRVRSERVQDLVAGVGSRDGAPLPVAAELAEAVRLRDTELTELLTRWRERGHGPVEIGADALAAALPEKSVAVGFRRIARWTFEKSEPLRVKGKWRYVAFVLRRDRSLAYVDLGPGLEIEMAIARWRTAIGKPVERGAAPLPTPDDERVAGEEIRRQVLDPVFAASGDATALDVCLDDSLHLLPLDALPLGDGVVGDRFQIHVETSFARLLGGARAVAGEPALLAAGAIDFDATSGDVAAATSDATADAAERAGPGGLAFGPLRETKYEVDNIADLFGKQFGKPATLLKGGAATRDALVREAERARWIHIATHGYFAAESVLCASDGALRGAAADPLPAPSLPLGEAVVGLAPMALCGIALAGANRGADQLGRVAGVLTAEEIQALDLKNCDLTVLSACETNVGIKRSGLGILSLQSALHAAGARTAITSLWKVDDDRTRELMVDFYRRLWIEHQPKASALWQAKKALRAKGASVRDWAAWILSGDPGS